MPFSHMYARAAGDGPIGAPRLIGAPVCGNPNRASSICVVSASLVSLTLNPGPSTFTCERLSSMSSR